MDSSNENLTFSLIYKQDNDEHWKTVSLKNVCKSSNSNEYRVEYTVSNAKPGRYTCQIQSKCDFGISQMSNERSAYKEEEVGLITFFQVIKVIACLELFFS